MDKKLKNNNFLTEESKLIISEILNFINENDLKKFKEDGDKNAAEQ